MVTSETTPKIQNNVGPNDTTETSMNLTIPNNQEVDDITLSSRTTSKTRSKTKGGKVQKILNSIIKYVKPRVEELIKVKSLRRESKASL